MRSFAPAVFLALGMASGVLAADCLLEQKRQSSEPTGEQIAKALTSNSALNNVCSGNWRFNDEYQLNVTYNHWHLLYYIERTDKNQSLRHCQEAFNNIISQCITNGNFWGGSWSVDGETFRVSNNAYPANGLGPNDEGGNPISSITQPPPSPSSTPPAGSFATTTMDIPGLTTHSATTTSADGHQTILPIWFVGVGIGIILIPGPGVPPNPIPPPPGFPPLVIGPDGQAHTTSRDPEPSSTTSSSSSSCTACSACAGFDVLPAEVTSLLPNDGDPDLPTVDPNIWSSMATMHPTPTPPAGPNNGTPTQAAAPVDRPACADAHEDVKQDLLMWTTQGRAIRLSDGSYRPVDDILYRIRQVVCDGTCTAPSGIDSKFVAVYKNDKGACEVSVAVSAQTELYVNSDMGPPDNQDRDMIRQQCWDSTKNIINKCVRVHQASSGWWNGNHQYQFYSGGVRPLNHPDAHHTKDGILLNKYLMPTTDGLSCGRDCCGFFPNTDWCNKNCGRPSCRRGARWSSGAAIFARATQSIARVGGCNLPYVLPDYPSSGTAQGINAVQKWYDRDNTNVGNNNCNNPRLTQFANRVPGSEYDTEHVFEKHIIKRFLHFLVGGEQAFDDSTDPTGKSPVTDCQQAGNVFNQLNPAAGSDFRTETAAAQIAKAVSCKGTGCPVQDGSRDGEFFLLRKEINSFKNRIFTGHYTGIGHDNNNNKVPRCSSFQTHPEMQQAMINAALVFKYMNRQQAFDSFNAVHTRIRHILTRLDADNVLGAANPPLNLRAYIDNARPNTWLTAYDEFMVRFLVDTERKMGKWLHDCKESYRSKIDQIALRNNWSQQQIANEKGKVDNYQTGDGAYADGALKLDVAIWVSIRGNEMT